MTPGLGLARISLDEFILRLTQRTGQANWFVLVAPETEAAVVAERIQSGVAAMSNVPVERVEAPASADLIEQAAHHEALLIVSSVEGLDDAAWTRLDLLRSRLARERPVVLVLSRPGARRLFAEAPHLASWIGGSAWEMEPTEEALSDQERARRIASLERWAGMTSDEMLARAERAELPPDPEFAEWVVLVGRSDLLGH